MAYPYQTDAELELKTKKVAQRISENMHIVANEPSLALFRLQEHVRKALPPTVEKRVQVNALHDELQGRCYDVEYALGAVKSMDTASTSFANTQELLKQAIFLKQQLKYEETRRQKRDGSSVYKRLSAHLPLDLPDLSDISVVRETTTRIENMMAQARGAGDVVYVDRDYGENWMDHGSEELGSIRELNVRDDSQRAQQYSTQGWLDNGHTFSEEYKLNYEENAVTEKSRDDLPHVLYVRGVPYWKGEKGGHVGPQL